MRQWLDQKFQQSIRQRFPRVLSGTVTQRQLFVLPSLNGISWVLLALVIWLTGINYQNGLVLLVAYLMASIWLAGMWLCYRNLLGITYRVARVRHAEEGGQAEVEIEFDSSRARFDIAVRCTTGEWRYTDVSSQQTGRVRVLVELPIRGVYKLPALRLETRQPFDLAVVWSQIRLQAELFAYPVAKHAPAKVHAAHDQSDLVSTASTRGDVDGLTDWQAGDEISRIRWSHYLVTGEARMTNFSKPAGRQSSVISLEQYRHIRLESALQAIAHQALVNYQEGRAYGLQLENVELPVAEGIAQLQRVREALARYGH